MLPSASPVFFKKLEITHKIMQRVDLSEIQVALDKISLSIRENRYYNNGLDLEKIGEVDGHHISSSRISDTKRIISLTIGQSMVIIRYLPTHNYPDMEKLKHFCKGFLVEYRANPEEVCRNIPLETVELSTPYKAPTAQLTLIADQCVITLDEEQSEVCYTTLPAKLTGGPGAGKTLAGLIVLMNKHYGDTLYYAKSPSLVKRQKALFEEQSVPDCSEAIRHFFSGDDLYPRAQTYSSKEVLSWVTHTIERDASSLQSVSPIYLVQELQTLYVLRSLFPKDFEKRYIENFGRSHYTSEQLADIPGLFTRLASRFFCDERRPYVEGFICRDPLPEKMLSLCVSDENQDCTVAENFFFFTKTENAHVLFLRDMKQSQEWQGIDPLSLFEAIWRSWLEDAKKPSLQMANLELRKSYRNSQAVTILANRRLRLQNMLLQGTVLKDEQPLFDVPETASGQVRLYRGVDTPEFQAMREHFPENSTQWAVLTSPENKARARETFGENVLIFDTKSLPGLEFTCEIRWEATDRAILAEQEEEPILGLLANPKQELYLQKSPLLQSKVKFIQATAGDIATTTRAKAGILVVEPPVNPKDFATKKKARTVQKALEWLYPPEEYSKHDEPWTINMRASTVAEWEEFIRRLWEQGVRDESERLFNLHIQSHTSLNFLEWADPTADMTAAMEDLAMALETTAVQIPTLESVHQKPEIDKPKKKSAKKAEAEVLSLQPVISSAGYMNIKNAIDLQSYSGQDIRVDSCEDLITLLFGRAVLLLKSAKKPLGVTRTLNNDTVSLVTAFCETADKKTQAIILSKIQKLLGFKGLGKLAFSVEFFQAPCPESLKIILQLRGVTFTPHSLGAGLFWMSVHYPGAAEILGAMLSGKNSSADIKKVADFLEVDWTRTLQEESNLDALSSAGYEDICQFFLRFLKRGLELSPPLDNHQYALFYNIALARKPVATAKLEQILSSLSREEYADLYTYRSKKTGLNVLELAYKNRDLYNIWHFIGTFRSLYDEYETRLPGNTMDFFWGDWKSFVSASDKETIIKVVDIALWCIDMDWFPKEDIVKLYGILNFLLCSNVTAEEMSKVFFKIESVLPAICDYENSRKAIALDPSSGTTRASEERLLILFLYRKLFTNVQTLLKVGLDPAISEDTWTDCMRQAIEVQAPLEIVQSILSAGHQKLAGKQKVASGFICCWLLADSLGKKLSESEFNYRMEIVEAMFEHGQDILGYGIMLGNLVRNLKKSSFLFSRENAILDTQDSNYFRVRVVYLLFFMQNFKANIIAAKQIHKMLKQAQADRTEGVVANTEFNRQVEQEILDSFDMSLSVFSEVRDKKTFFIELLEHKNIELAEALAPYGIDLVSHPVGCEAPLVQVLRHVIERKDQVVDWKALALTMIPLMPCCSRKMLGSGSAFISLLVTQEFRIAQALLEAKLVDLKGIVSVQKERTVLKNAAFCLLTKNRAATFFPFLKAFIETLREESLLSLIEEPYSSQYPFTILEYVSQNYEMEYFNVLLDAYPESIFSRHTWNISETKNFDMRQPSILICILTNDTIPNTPIVHDTTGGSELYNLLMRSTDTYSENIRSLGGAIKEKLMMCLKICSVLEQLQQRDENSSELVISCIDSRWNHQYDSKKTAIFCALHSRLFNIVDRLLDMGASLILPDQYESLLLFAIFQGAPKNTLLKILKKASEGSTPARYLNETLFNKSFSDLKRFMMRMPMTPEQLATEYSGIQEATPVSHLEAAIFWGHCEAVELFFKKGSFLPRGKGCLILAVQSQSLNMVKTVLEKIHRFSYDAAQNEKHPAAMEIALSAYIDDRTSEKCDIIVLLLDADTDISEHAERLLGQIAHRYPNVAIQEAHKKATTSGLELKKALLLSKYGRSHSGADLEVSPDEHSTNCRIC